MENYNLYPDALIKHLQKQIATIETIKKEQQADLKAGYQLKQHKIVTSMRGLIEMVKDELSDIGRDMYELDIEDFNEKYID